MIRSIAFITLLIVSAASVRAQQPDTVVVNLTNTTRVVLTMEDRNDINVLKDYDFQQLFDDIIVKLESNDTTPALMGINDSIPEAEQEDTWADEVPFWEDDDNNDDDDEWDWDSKGSDKPGRTTQSFNFDLGTNNYVSDGKFPDSENATYSVRPWGSWYVGLNSIQRTRVARNFFVEWGMGLSWYNFKFQKDNILIEKDDLGVSFVEDNTADIDFRKSKLTVSYINVSLVPMLDFSNSSTRARMWDSSSSFRIGLGPYLGYRIGSYSKIKYKEAGETEKDKNHDSFYLENIRYGMRLQIGFRSTDLFFNYDMNDLFSPGKGPSLNAFSFGVVF